MTKTHPIDKRFNEVKFFVEADSYAHSHLWRDYANQSDTKLCKGEGLDWQDEDGTGRSVGQLAGHDVFVSLRFTKLDGIYVCVYYATSYVVDHKMIEKFLIDKCGMDSLRQSDADNFHNIYHAIKRMNEKKNEQQSVPT